MEAYLDQQETRVNRTVVCWNGILAWIGWCLSVIQVIIAIVYFKVDDGEISEENLEEHLSHRQKSQLQGQYRSANSLFDPNVADNRDDFYGGRHSRAGYSHSSQIPNTFA